MKNDYKGDRLNNVDFVNKTKAFKQSWIRRHYNNSLYE